VLSLILSSVCSKAQNNILSDTADCGSSRPAFAFTISKKWEYQYVNNFCTPLAGDLDGDGNTEILCQNLGGTSILIFDGETGVKVGEINTGTLAKYASNPYAICDVEGDGKAEIIIVNSYTNSAMLYTVSSGTGVRPITFAPVWASSTSLPGISTYASHSVIPAVADLDGDGEPEFVAAQYVIETDGTVVGTMSFGSGILGPSDVESISYVVDLDNDGIPEIVAGTDVYKYNGVTLTLWKRCPVRPNGFEGTNMGADINLDGKVDLVFHDTRNKSVGKMIIWTPVDAPAPGVYSTTGIIDSISNLLSGYRCYPVIGDIDGIVSPNGKKYPEICYNAQNHLFAYSFDGTSFSQKFDMPTNEGTGVATFTFFDFNNDGHAELVYRDELNLRILECSGASPVEVYSMPATSATVIETPIVADVTGDGSADIIVTGTSRLYVFEGAESKWASCPAVWNQQLYSPLLINRDLTVISSVKSPAWVDSCGNDEVRYYNGGPMQAPFISASTSCPIDIAPDPYVITGTITYLTPTSVRLEITIGNQGIIKAESNIPIRFYKDAMMHSNILDSAVLGVNLAPGQSTTVIKVLNGLTQMPTRFYARIMDDGTNFPAIGPFSDCNLTNNHKSFGTLELLKTVDSHNACIDGTSIFNILLINNTNQTSVLDTFCNVILCDSLGPGWSFLYDSVSTGTLSGYNSLTRKDFWTVDSIFPGDTVKMLLLAKAVNAGAIRNSAWLESVNDSILGKEVIEAYVIVNSTQAPDSAVISAQPPSVCGNVVLLNSMPGKSSYQWFLNGNEISGATSATYTATVSGNYTVTYFQDPCVSKMSAAFYVDATCYHLEDDYATVMEGSSVEINVLANDVMPAGYFSGAFSLCDSVIQQPVAGTSVTCTGSGVNSKIIYSNTSLAGLTNGVDSIKYQLSYTDPNTSTVVTRTATVYISVLQKPDVISDEDCFVEPESFAFTIRELSSSASSYSVNAFSSVYAGDIDNDKKIELIAFKKNTYSTTSIYIFEVDSNTNAVSLQQELTTPNVSTITSPITIGNVDGGNYAAIFVLTRTTENTGNNIGRLIKYTYNGTSYTESGRVQYSSSDEAFAPMLADLNRDGIAEVVVGDKVFNARTLTLLVDGNLAFDPTMGFGRGAHYLVYPPTPTSSIMAIGDMDNDGFQEVIGGHSVYKVNITNTSGTSGNSFVLWSRCDSIGPLGAIHNEVGDGPTAIADIDLDGFLDVVVTTRKSDNSHNAFYIWNPRTHHLLHSNTVDTINIASSHVSPSLAFIGNIDMDPEPEICFAASFRMYAYDYNISAKTLSIKYVKTTNEDTGSTTMCMFDFNQDGMNEIVYRSQDKLMIIDGQTGTTLSEIACTSPTANEYPIVVDVNNDDAAEIVVTGNDKVRIFSSNSTKWAPTRKVWNQYAYNVVNINNDLTVPKYPLSPSQVFAGPDSITGTADDVRPFNGYLKQQTLLNKYGNPLWLTPNILLIDTSFHITHVNDSIAVSVCIENQGDAPVIAPFYLTLYKDSVKSDKIIKVDSIMTELFPGDTGCITIMIPDSFMTVPFVNYIIRANDRNGIYPLQQECDYRDSVLSHVNPFLSELMHKDAVVNAIANNGTYPNPVTVLFKEDILYEITAVNANPAGGNMTVTDTLPEYLYYNSPPSSFVDVYPAGSRTAVRFHLYGLLPYSTVNVSFMATPESAACASQPLFINRAWVRIPYGADSLVIPTRNSTYHQGAGTCVVTFSATAGGSIFNADPQAIDFMTAPRSGILVAADEGYLFTGWRHEAYTSHRGEIVPACEGVMYYDSLTVYGNVELRAEFKPEEYPIMYYLNGSSVAVNPNSYTIESPDIILTAPSKQGDFFTGWTGSNGDVPQMEVEILHGSTGKREYYANFLYSGREKEWPLMKEEDAVWAADNELLVRTWHSDAIIRIYTPDGVLVMQKTILKAGLTSIPLRRGLYIVTLNGGTGKKVAVE
jgi:uncharacterized repeat protein (TIGR02543 family)/uncharacterized repeat protein (TIGR01451 family)